MTDPAPSPVRDEGAEMLARHLAGDVRAFPELMERFGGPVFGYLKRSGLPGPVAEDLFQETFLRVHRSAQRYDPAAPFRAWLFTITHNLVRSHFRKQKVRRIMVGWWRRPPGNDPGAEPAPLDPPDPGPGADRRVAAQQELRYLERALADLPAGPRRALLLIKVEGLSHEDAATVLGVPLGTVKTWARRARLALAEALAASEKGDQR